MIEYFKQYFKWSNKNFTDNNSGRCYVSKTGRLGTIIISYFILFFSWMIFLFPPFPFLAKLILFIGVVLSSIDVIFLADFRFIKIIRLYLMSKKIESSIYCKIVYNTFFSGLSKQMKSNLCKFFINYNVVSINSFMVKLFVKYSGKKYKLLFTANQVKIVGAKKVKINNQVGINELFDEIKIKIDNMNSVK